MAADILAPQFQDADKAREYLERLRWPNGPVCPHCGVEGQHYALKGAAHRPGLWKCKDCRKQFSVTVGTVFERSKVPLNKWLLAVHLICASKKAMSSHQIHRMLGVTYKSAWFMAHRIRETMKPGSTGLMGTGGGVVEADETYWGNNGKQRKGARGYAHKMKVVSLVERNGEKRSIVVPAVTGKTLRAVLEANVSKSAHLMTDEHAGYTKVGREFASHNVTRHSRGEYAVGNVHSNTAESSFSLLKRGLIGTFHHVGEQHLQRYVTEFDFRWNNRKLCDSDRTQSLLRQVGGRRLTYRVSDR
ncbi:ISSpo8, transposase [Mizugakiibacter sediminis]|uniref:ISSpo8, transposase n=1 Tax=Mizugakiibacter sediminis TaxID=1475481 RepID=A0A0K8QKR5_9GAMM|nr:IS1595 family transposase [Mizugakiibacter sediminis]GAP65077.1 ISSpo8, transposase [Mizugakiibacter sediminis]